MAWRSGIGVAERNLFRRGGGSSAAIMLSIEKSAAAAQHREKQRLAMFAWRGNRANIWAHPRWRLRAQRAATARRAVATPLGGGVKNRRWRQRWREASSGKS